MAFLKLSVTGGNDNPYFSAFTIFIGGDNVQGTHVVNDNNRSGNDYPSIEVTSPTALNNGGSPYFECLLANGDGFIKGYDGSGWAYSTWRSVSISGQYPSSGMSLDIWQYSDPNDSSPNFYNHIFGDTLRIGGAQYEDWNLMTLSDRTYSLAPDKYSLLYDYDNLYAPVYWRGGTMVVSYETTIS